MAAHGFRPTRILAATLGAPAAARAVVASTSAAIEARRNTATPSTEKYEHAADYCEIAGLARSRRSADSSAAPAAPTSAAESPSSSSSASKAALKRGPAACTPV